MQRTWAFDQINYQLDSATVGENEAYVRRMLRELKDRCVASVPGCTITGSSDGVAAGMDAVDRWDADADLVWGEDPTPHSWIVLRFANMGGAELLIDLWVNLADDSTQALFEWAPSGGYTGGSNTARPTSTTGTGGTSALFQTQHNDDTTRYDLALHVLYTDDGEQLRVAALTNRVIVAVDDPFPNMVTFVLTAGLVDDPPAEWATPSYLHVSYGLRASDEAVAEGDAGEGAALAFSLFTYTAQAFHTGARSGGLSAETFDLGNDPVGAYFSPDLFSNRHRLIPQRFYIFDYTGYDAGQPNSGVTMGFAGYVSDQLWAPYYYADVFGHRFDLTGTRYELANGDAFLQLDDLAWPWAAASPFVLPDGTTFAGDTFDAEIQCNCAASAEPTPPIAVVSPAAAAPIDRGAGDLALTWSVEVGDADLSLLGSDIASDRGLRTAVLLSLFTDRRAEPDDKPPSGDPRDRRGWWADQFALVKGDRFGSRLWLLDRSVRTNETARRAEEYVREALAWMLEDRVVASIDVTVETTSKDLLIAIGLQRPGRDPVTFRFAHAWNHMEQET